MKKNAANAMLSSLGRLKELAKDDLEALEPASPSQVKREEASQSARVPREGSGIDEGFAGYPLYEAGRQYVAGDRILLPLEIVRDNPHNPRVFYLEAGMESLLSSIATAGQLTAAQVFADEASGEFMLKSGHRRKRALRLLGKSHIKVEVVSRAHSALDEYKQARDLNVEHKSQTHFDDALRFKALIEEGVARDQKTLAQELNIPEAEISKILRIGTLPETLLREMAEHQTYFGLSASYHVYRFWASSNKNPDRALALIRRVIERGLSVRQLEKLVKEGDSPAPLPRARMLERVSLTGPGKVELKAYDEKIMLHAEDLPYERRAEIVSLLVSALEKAGFGAEPAVKNSTTEQNSESL